MCYLLRLAVMWWEPAGQVALEAGQVVAATGTR